MSESLTWESLGYGLLRILKTPLALPATWVKLFLNLNANIAPEVMCRQNHCCAVDYFALGVIGYEFMLGRVSPKCPSAALIIALEAIQCQIKKGN